MIWDLKNKQNDELKKIFTSAVALISGNFISAAIGLATTLVQGRFVTAEMLGYFKQFSILSGYLFIFHLGTYQALERYIPFFYGKNKEETAKEYTAVTYFWISLCSIIISIIFIILGIRSINQGDYRDAICWGVQLITSVYTLVSGVLASTYRSIKDFEKLAKANIIGSIATLFALPVFWINPFIGLVLKSVLNAISIIPLLKNRPIRVRPIFSFPVFGKLLKQGFPIFTASYITGTGLDTIRNTLVLTYASHVGLGLWNFAYMFYTMVIIIPNSVVAVINPRIIRLYGQTGSLKSVVNKYKKTVLFMLLAMFVCATIGGVLLVLLVPIVLPNYIESIPIMLALLPCFVLRAMELFYTMLLAVNDMKGINVISFISSVFQIVSIIVLHLFANSVYIFPSSLTAGIVLRIVLILFRIRWLEKKESV